jgi:tripartite-type tricarboxylate transporter receptor subunit TctC
MVPKGTPQPALDLLRRMLAKVVAEAEFRVAVAPDEPFVMAVPAFEAFLLGENTKWERLVRESGATAD